MPRSSQRLPSILALGLFGLTLAGCTPRFPPLPEKWVNPAQPKHDPRPMPEASWDAANDGEGSLLASYAERKATPLDKRSDWSLPTNAKTVIVELLVAASHDDVEHVRNVLTDNARWGMPDRRELQAQPVFSKQDPLGLEFLTGFRNVTSRLKKKAGFNCRPMQPGWELLVANGAEPMWCSYQSDDGFDLLAFRLVTIAGEPKIDYVGFMRERPEGFIRAANVGDPPPLTPYAKEPVSLEPIELMPDGTSPVVEAPKRAEEPAKPEPAPAEPAPAGEGDKPTEQPVAPQANPAQGDDAKPPKADEAKPADDAEAPVNE